MDLPLQAAAVDWSCQLRRIAHQQLSCHRQQPHYGVLWLEKLGSGSAELDFAPLGLAAPCALFWAPGQICRYELRDASGWELEFGLDTFCQSGLNDALLNSLGLFAPLDATPLLRIPPAALDEIGQIWRWWEREHEDLPFFRPLAASYLRLLLLRCGRLADPVAPDPAPTEGLWPHFRQLLETHFRRWHQVSHYAEVLAVTPDHLNELVKAASGRSAKQLIQERLMLEARRSAWFSQDSLKQIAYDLGFEDPAYFSRLFRRCTGQTFSEFRTRMEKG